MEDLTISSAVNDLVELVHTDIHTERVEDTIQASQSTNNHSKKNQSGIGAEDETNTEARSSSPSTTKTGELMIPQSCPLCFQDESSKMIACKQCSKNYHWIFVGLNKFSADIIQNYYCKTCRTEHHKLVDWKLAPQVRGLNSKTLKYFEVGRILDHKGSIIGKRMFLIKWKSFPTSQSTWEKESHLDRCTDILKTYCDAYPIPYETPGLVGYSRMAESNKDNWVDLNVVIKIINRMAPLNKLKLSIWNNELANEDTIYIINHSSHCYVLLWLPYHWMGYIADGTNMFINETQVAEEISDMLDVPLKPLNYDDKIKEDHCGSSAIFIALELIRHHKLKIPYDKLTHTNKTMHKRVINWLHPYKSNSLGYKRLYEQRKVDRCPHCNKSFFWGQSSNLKRHIAMNHKKSN